MLRCMCFAAAASQAIGQRENFSVKKQLVIGDDEAESPFLVQFEIGAVVRKKYRVDDEIRDFLRFGRFSLFIYLFLLVFNF